MGAGSMYNNKPNQGKPDFRFEMQPEGGPFAIACSVSIKKVPVYEQNSPGEIGEIIDYNMERICNTRGSPCDYREQRENNEPLCTKANNLIEEIERRLLNDPNIPFQ